MRILVLGASGMLGSAVVRILAENNAWQVYGTLRSSHAKRFFQENITKCLLTGVDAEQQDSLLQTFITTRPNVVINCIGLVKQHAEADNPLQVIPINTLLPHRLAKLCELVGARLIHISTDCVFAGDRGNYHESDVSDARDLYGKSKYLGEVSDPHTITLRTSIIGHELQSSHGLMDWFLSQQQRCNGYTKTIFSGMPTITLAKIIRDAVIPRPDLYGVYHVAASPISKHDLLQLVARVYGKTIEIVPDDTVKIDRSLNADRFRDATGYVTPSWEELIQ
ncbi:MAG: dTDP-4-dehydrorhamnose reductase family protein, partial [Methylophilaceae bacterium]